MALHKYEKHGIVQSRSQCSVSELVIEIIEVVIQEVVHISQKLSSFHKPPNNIRVQLLWICFSLAPPDPVFWYLKKNGHTSWQPGDRQPEDNGLPSYQRPMVYRKNAAWQWVSEFFGYLRTGITSGAGECQSHWLLVSRGTFQFENVHGQGDFQCQGWPFRSNNLLNVWMVRLTQQFVLASDPEVGATDGRFIGERAGYYIIGGEGGGSRTGNRDI